MNAYSFPFSSEKTFTSRVKINAGDVLYALSKSHKCLETSHIEIVSRLVLDSYRFGSIVLCS